MVRRKFEIELSVPDDFDETHHPPQAFSGLTVVQNGALSWSIYADPKVREQQWRKATRDDEGNCNARFRDMETEEWITGKLLHYQPSVFADLPYLGLVKTVRGGDDEPAPEWFAECEVPL